MDTDESPTRSNHDRQSLEHVSQAVYDIEMSEPGNKRSPLNDELEDNNLASDDMSLESLQKDMGDAFLLCKSSKTIISSVC